MPVDFLETIFGAQMGHFGGNESEARLRIYSLSESREILEDPHRRRTFYSEGTGPLRGAPFLSVHLGRSKGEESQIAVGRALVRFPRERAPFLRVLVTDAWTSESLVDSKSLSHWKPVESSFIAHDAVMNMANTAIVGKAETDEWRATLVAKAFAEGTLEAMTLLQNLRQAHERIIAEVLRGGTNKELESGLDDLVTLSLISSQVRQESAAAHRQAMWSYFTAPDQYFAVRRLRDATLLKRRGDARARRKPEFNQLDAAVRHCEKAVSAAEFEIDRLNGLIAMASTVTAARDTRLQEEFNQVATIGSIVIAVPALLFTFYGADSILPFNPLAIAVVAPIGFSVIAGIAIALLLPAPSRRHRSKRAMIAGLALFATTLILAISGIFLPKT